MFEEKVNDWQKIEPESGDVTYWYNSKTHSSSWINPEKLSREYYKKRRENESNHYLVSLPRKKAGKPRTLEDYPLLAIKREELLQKCFDILVEENNKYGEWRGNTKTAKSCREDGMRVGMQGIFARIMWYELLEQAHQCGEVGANGRDSILPTVFKGDPAVKKEFLDAGRNETITENIMNAVGRAMMEASRELLQLRHTITTIPPTITQHNHTIRCQKKLERINNNSNNNFHQVTFYELHFQQSMHAISEAHLQKLLHLYQLHTNPLATVQDSIFVSHFCNLPILFPIF